MNRGGSLSAQIWGCSPWNRPMMFGSAESEHSRLTNGEIISHVFQPMWSQSTNVTDRETDRRTDRQTDRQTTCDHNTALCTKVHRAVKMFPNKNWTLSVASIFLRSVFNPPSVERRSGSGRPRTVRVPDVIANVQDLVLIQENAPKKQSTADFTSNRSFTGVCQQNYSQGLASDVP